MIKLYNNSPLSDDVILPLLKLGFKISKIKGTIAVRIPNGKRGGGVAFDCNRVRWGKSKRWVNVDGAIEVSPYFSFDYFRSANEFWETMLHEFKHVYDHQNRKKEYLPFSTDNGFDPVKRKWKRRPPHDERPEELRAFRFTKENKNKIDDELLLNLAIEFERVVNLKYKDGIP